MPRTQVAAVDNYEFGAPVLGDLLDVAAIATAVFEAGAQPTEADTVVIDDGIVEEAITFEFTTAAAPATGTIAVAVGNAADTNTVTIDDGVVASALVFEFNSAPVAATGTITLAGQPGDTNTITIDDGIVAVGVVFEFDDGGGVTEGNTAVLIGTDVPATLTNLQTAINASALAITAGDPADGAIALTHDVPGSAGNATSLKDGANITVTGMASGSESTVTEGNTAVLIGTTNVESLTNLRAAINASTLAITAAAPSGGAIALTNDNDGVAGNVTITKDGANITVTGMAGGDDGTTAEGNVAVSIGADATATANNLVTAVQATALAMTGAVAVDAGTGDVTITLTMDSRGTAGNAGTITVDGDTPPTVDAAFAGGLDYTATVKVQQFKVIRPGVIDVRIEADEANLTVSIQVSEDGTLWFDATAAANGTACSELAVQAKTVQDVTVKLRADKDNYVRVSAKGGGRGRIQFRGDAQLDIVKV